ncbi:MAG: hypothetical protein GYB66_05080, partial [Chloroflexi bacterium]|nr:hypothetical protein [Chloroflexota bacterium]
DLAGTNEIQITLAGSTTIDELRIENDSQIPALATALPKPIAAVNQEYALADHPINEQDEIAFFPPVSGGAEQVWPEVFLLSQAPISLDELTSKIVVPQTGALAVFSGYVRGQTQHADQLQQTSYLEYEAYEDMAFAKLRQVASEIRQQWPLVQGIAIVQRLGRLDVGTPTVFIACGGGHRDQGCFEAARYGIDRLKEIVPVWKKEVSPEGSYWVEGAYYPSSEDRSSDHHRSHLNDRD